MRCGYCGGGMPDGWPAEVAECRCPCGRRAITRLGMGVVLTHAPGCPGEVGCSCWIGTRIPRRTQSVLLNEMRLCPGGVPSRDRKGII